MSEKYSDAQITDKLIYQLGFYKDPEFIDNVHFKKYTKSYFYDWNLKKKAAKNT